MSAIYGNWHPIYGNPDWFLHDRFGLFIHWGLYSSAARHEWVMSNEKIHPDQYRKYFDHFDPDLYDAKSWAKAAKNSGMKYVVITTKHHDGFCLWDSQLTDYKATNTPCGKDLIRPFVEAFREEGLKIGFYYSLIDWHHPEFPIDGFHPMKADEQFKEAAAGRDITKYAEYLHGQVRELLTGYGKIDYLWFDFSYAGNDWGWAKGKGAAEWQSEKLERMILELQPEMILNDRLDLSRGVVTPEQFQPGYRMERGSKPVVWEACQTTNGSWGYHRDNMNWKSAEMLVKMLIDTVSAGGNLLLNVGPNARGEFDKRSLATLEGIGEWMRLHSRSIYGAGASEYTPPSNCRFTQRGDRLYIHLYSWPFQHLHLEGLKGRVAYAQLLNDASEIKMIEMTKHMSQQDLDETPTEEKLTLQLPIQCPDVAVPVIELFLKRD